MVVHGSIRVLSEQCAPAGNFHVRAIQADVNADVVNGSVGWQLDARGCGIGRHFSDHHQDPLLVKPDISGQFFRTTLVEGNDKRWYVMELCEQLQGLVQLDAQFYEMHGRRNIITFITDAEKDPLVMGFHWWMNSLRIFRLNQSWNKMLQLRMMQKLPLKVETYQKVRSL